MILTLLLPGFLTNDYSRSYSQLILTSFWTRWTIIDQFIVKGAHQWSCEKKFWWYLKNWLSYSHFKFEIFILKYFSTFSEIPPPPHPTPGSNRWSETPGVIGLIVTRHKPSSWYFVRPWIFATLWDMCQTLGTDEWRKFLIIRWHAQQYYTKCWRN